MMGVVPVPHWRPDPDAEQVEIYSAPRPGTGSWYVGGVNLRHSALWAVYGREFCAFR